jgi:Zn-dependent protease
LQDLILGYLIALPGILWALSVHEFAHGYVAYKLGDPTPKFAGRLTLNPLAHIDIIGFIALFLVHFGWAKPVPVNPRNFVKVSSWRKGEILVSLAGPLANFLSAFLCIVFLEYFPFNSIPSSISEPLFLMVKYSVFINVAFGVFNLIPIPPLDGSKILEAVLPYNLWLEYKKIEPYGPIILIILVISPVINWILLPLVNGLIKLMLFVT